MDKRKAYIEKLEAQLEEWDAKIDLLKAKSKKTKAEAKIEYCNKIETLQHKYKEMQTKLYNLKTATGEAWEDIKTGVEKAVDELKDTFDKVLSKFE